MSANRNPATTTPQDTDGVFATLWRLLAATNSFASNLGTFLTTFASRFPSRQQGTAFASAARTATATSADITLGGARGIVVFWSVTAAGVGAISLRLLGKDPATGGYFSMGAPTTTFAAGTGAVICSWGIGAGGVSSANNGGGVCVVLPDVVAIQVSHSDGTSYTYSVGFSAA